MKTSDFYIKPSSKNINESMKKKFGEKLDLDSYSTDQLNKTFKLIENKMAGYKNSKFNDTLKSEEYHRLTFMRDAVRTDISERKAKPDFLDLDKDGNKKEPMKKAAKDKDGGEGKKEGKKGMSAKQQKFFGKKKPVKESVDMAISRYLREGEEGKAELVMAVKNMVDKFTGWSEDIAKMQAQSAMEMADEIRDELGSDQAEAFTQAIAPALDAAFQAVKAAREALKGQVGSMTGGGPAAMGAEPDMGGGMDAGMPGDDMGGDMPDMGGADMGAEPGADISAAGETPPGGREKRESIERTRRLTRILSGR